MKRSSDLFTRALAGALERPRRQARLSEIGRISSISEGVVTIEGFTRLAQDELLALDGGSFALAASITEAATGAILLSPGADLKVGAAARRTRRQADTPVGDALLGRVLTPLGQPLDGRGPLRATLRWPVERPAPAIIARDPVRRPLATGLKAVDAAIPVGRGQRELILGDRQTGKTSLAVDAILNQAEDMACVYCAIGQRQSAVSQVIDTLRRSGALARTITVVASGEDPPGLRYLAPYAATSMAEYFLEQGRDALIVYDDLTRHARAYRELSLLLRRPPGREAYPGDIFYLHARLLERATQLRPEHGGGSLTALPIIETQAQNLSAYIPTNLISITDGQIFLSPDLFEKGVLPAIDIGRSVSRVGGKAQPTAFRGLSGELKLFYAQFEELEAFARFGTRLDEDTKKRLERGRRVREILKQDERSAMTPIAQIATLLAATSGALDPVPTASIAAAEQGIIEALATSALPAWQEFDIDTPIDAKARDRLIADLAAILDPYCEDQSNGDA